MALVTAPRRQICSFVLHSQHGMGQFSKGDGGDMSPSTFGQGESKNQATNKRNIYHN